MLLLFSMETPVIPLTEEQKTQYFHRSFSAVDGLWFMKAEDRYDFDTALALDGEVWKVLPKIQARMMKKMGNLSEGIDALKNALETKLALEGHVFTIQPREDGHGFTVLITECPWNNLMVKSGRHHLAEKVGRTICRVEYPAWAAEYGGSVSFVMERLLCGGSDTCVMSFAPDGDTTDGNDDEISE